MAKLIADNGYDYALFGGGLLGFEIGAGIAARLGGGVTMEVTAVKVAGRQARRRAPDPAGLGDRRRRLRRASPGVIIGRLNAFEIAEAGGGDAEVEDVDVELSRLVDQGHDGQARRAARR